MWKLNPAKATREFRQVFVETLGDMMDSDERILALEADLGGASGFTKIAKKHPKQFIQVGIAEANMIGIAAGLSMRGYIPFTHTFAPFVTRRALDQVYLEGAYAQNTINIYGSDPGVCVGANGGTHNTFEDIAIMRTIPTVKVFAPADEVQLEWLIRTLPNYPGINYIRGNRKANPQVYAPGSTFEIGKVNVIREGGDIVLFSMGEMLSVAYEAAKELAAEGIETEVVDVFTIKPLDEEGILAAVAGKKAAFTFENHQIAGGLGGAVSEVMAEKAPGVALKRLGVEDRFGQVGTYAYLCEEFGLTKERIVRDVRAFLAGADNKDR
uniref:transketolase family protein n=1 Tax=Ndongobacter massiliensis TaxID=1871025 RepID=UPI0009315FA1|nr:transketolase C-terminal domain-containing protein [Ndongobacter massiliensis]